MSNALDVSKKYFEASNKSDFESISQLLTETTTYSSQNTGLYLGKDAILSMQRDFRASFATLHWHVNSAEEIKPGIVLFDYDFTGTKPDGENMRSSGLEYVIVSGGKIQHIEIRNKPAL